MTPKLPDSMYYQKFILSSAFFFFTQFGDFSFLTDYIEHAFEVSKEIFSLLGNQFLRFTSKPQNMYLCQILPCCEKLLKNLLEMQLARFAAKLHTLNLIFSWIVSVQHFHCLEHQLELYRQLFVGESTFNSTAVDIDREHIVDTGVNNNLVFYIVSALV